MGAYTSTANCIHSLTDIPVSLIQNQLLVVDNSTHNLTSDVISLVQGHLLSLDDATHLITAESPYTLITYICIPNNAEHILNSEHLTLGTNFHILVVSNSTHGIQSDVINLTSQQLLSVANSNHVMTSNTVGSLLVRRYRHLTFETRTSNYTLHKRAA